MSKDETPISDQLKKVVNDLALEDKVKEAAAASEAVVRRGLEATGAYLPDHRTDIEGFIDRAGAVIDRQTLGRFSMQVEEVRSQLSDGVARLADRQWAETNPNGPGELARAPDAADVSRTRETDATTDPRCPEDPQRPRARASLLTTEGSR